MSRTCLWNPVTRPDKSSKDLAAAKIGGDRACLVKFIGTQQWTQISTED
jgi:hypothetical protein